MVPSSVPRKHHPRFASFPGAATRPRPSYATHRTPFHLALCFHIHANHFCRNPLVLISIQNARGCTPLPSYPFTFSELQNPFSRSFSRSLRYPARRFRHRCALLPHSLRSCALGRKPNPLLSSACALFEKTTREGVHPVNTKKIAQAPAPRATALRNPRAFTRPEAFASLLNTMALAANARGPSFARPRTHYQPRESLAQAIPRRARRRKAARPRQPRAPKSSASKVRTSSRPRCAPD